MEMSERVMSVRGTMSEPRITMGPRVRPSSMSVVFLQVSIILLEGVWEHRDIVLVLPICLNKGELGAGSLTAGPVGEGDCADFGVSNVSSK